MKSEESALIIYPGIIQNEIQNQISTHNKENSYSGGGDYLENEHVEAHQHEDNHHHHHHNIYPNSKHPLGPVTLRLPNKD